MALHPQNPESQAAFRLQHDGSDNPSHSKGDGAAALRGNIWQGGAQGLADFQRTRAANPAATNAVEQNLTPSGKLLDQLHAPGINKMDAPKPEQAGGTGPGKHGPENSGKPAHEEAAKPGHKSMAKQGRDHVHIGHRVGKPALEGAGKHWHKHVGKHGHGRIGKHSHEHAKGGKGDGTAHRKRGGKGDRTPHGKGGEHIPTGSHSALISQALKLAGVPATAANINAVNKIVTRESAWKAGAINKWDSNARAGHPSKGLMQTIPGTFSKYAIPGHNTNIYDPVSNLVAGIRYAEARYGHGAGGGAGIRRVAGRPGGY